MCSFDPWIDLVTCDAKYLGGCGLGMRVTEGTGPGYLSVPWGWKVHLWEGMQAWNWEEQLRVFTVMPGVVQPSPLVLGQKAPLRD